jgi:hypothetical protein
VGIIEEARKREYAAAAARVPIDYARMAKVYPRQKAALTRAVKSGDPERIAKACKDAVAVWDEIGAWPDDWARWQRALDDALGYNRTVDIRYL